MKKLISLLLVVILSVSLVPPSIFANNDAVIDTEDTSLSSDAQVDIAQESEPVQDITENDTEDESVEEALAEEISKEPVVEESDEEITAASDNAGGEPDVVEIIDEEQPTTM